MSNAKKVNNLSLFSVLQPSTYHSLHSHLKDLWSPYRVYRGPFFSLYSLFEIMAATLEGVIDENTRPEDFEYAEGVAVDIRQWVSDRYYDKQLTSFRQSDCKEVFMTVNDKYLHMACKVLVDQNFVTIEGKRIPVYNLTETAIERLDEENKIKQQVLEEERKVAEQSRQTEHVEVKKTRPKRERQPQDDPTTSSDEDDDDHDVHVAKKADTKPDAKNDTKKELLSIRERPFALLGSEITAEDIPVHSFVVTELSKASAVDTTVATVDDSAGTGESRMWEVMQIVNSLISPDEGFCQYADALAEVQKRIPEVSRELFDSILSQGQKDNKIMLFEEQIFRI